jgi:2-keto-4-pentenoate hydratase/2-oxohepta-3-ene-1,7-dioic acid hydratase in catechol pathway
MDIAPTLPLSEIRLRSPLERPALIRDFMVYEGHMQNVYPKLGREIPGEWYNFPSYYKGNPSSVSGPGDTVNLPRYAELLDYECELACVVRKPALNVLSRDAEKHIAGYMLYNDLSARGYQSREMTIGLGPAKGKDFLGGHVLGPILVTPDEISDIYNQTVEISINDTLISRCSTRGMRWNFADLIAYASYDEYVAAGEVFGSGTLTGGSGIESGRMLREGDRIKIYSHNLGALTTYIGPRIDQPNDVPHPEGVRSLLG